MARVTVGVVGGRGFLGTALCASLAVDQVPVVEINRETPFDSAGCAVSLAGCDTIYYLASTINPAIAERDDDAVRTDLDALGSFLDVAARAAADALLVLPSSGGTVYDPDHPPPYSETSPVRGHTRYAAAKLAMENLVREQRPATSVVLRISNAYGPGQRTGTGQGVIAHWLAAAAAGEPVRVLGDLRQARDFVHVDDVVSALRSARRGGPPVVNIGSGRPTTLGELASLVDELLGGVEMEYAGSRGFDVQHTWLEIGLAKESMGWMPSVSLRDGLTRTLQHVALGAEPDLRGRL